MLQKIIQVGNSAAVTIPREMFNQLNLKVGGSVLVDVDMDDKILKINPQPKKIAKVKQVSLKPEFVAWADKFIDDNNELFKKLANQ